MIAPSCKGGALTCPSLSGACVKPLKGNSGAACTGALEATASSEDGDARPGTRVRMAVTVIMRTADGKQLKSGTRLGSAGKHPHCGNFTQGPPRQFLY